MIQSEQKEKSSEITIDSEGELARGKDAFISYARGDRKFVEKLYQALKKMAVMHGWIGRAFRHLRNG